MIIIIFFLILIKNSNILLKNLLLSVPCVLVSIALYLIVSNFVLQKAESQFQRTVKLHRDKPLPLRPPTDSTIQVVNEN